MRESDLAKVLQEAETTYPDVRWMGVLLGDGWDGAAITGVLDGLSSTRHAGGDSDTTVAEAIAEIRDDLRDMWRRD